MFAKARLIIFGAVLGMTAILLFLAISNIRDSDDSDSVPFSEFSIKATQGRLDLVKIDGMTAFGRLETGDWISTRLPEDHGEFVGQLTDLNVVVEVIGNESPTWLAAFTTFLPVVLVVGFWAWVAILMRRANKLAREQLDRQSAAERSDRSIVD